MDGSLEMKGVILGTIFCRIRPLKPKYSIPKALETFWNSTIQRWYVQEVVSILIQ